MKTEKPVSADRRRFLGTAAAAGAMTLAAPLIARAENSTLNITGWGGKWGEVFEASITPMFEKEFGGKIVRDTAFPFLPKLQASSRRNPIYDVLHSNTNEQWAAMKMGIVDKELDKKAIPNMADLYDYATSSKMVGVAMFTSAIGFSYRTDRIATAPTSWKDLWKPEYADKRGAYVIPVNSFGQALFCMAGKVYGSGYDDLDASFAAMEKLKPVKLADFTGAMEKMVLSGDVDIAVMHDAATYRYYETPNPIRFAKPEEGLISLEQVLNTTPGTQKRELANAFINFMLRPDIQKLLSEAVWYSPTNKKTVLDGVYQERLLTSPEKVAQLVQIDWEWYNAHKEQIDQRVNRIFKA